MSNGSLPLPRLPWSRFLLLAAFMVGSLWAQPGKPAPAPAPTPELPPHAVARGGGWMALTIENGSFMLRFYDAEKKPVAPDVARANARWDNPLKTGQLRAVLNPSSDGLALVGNRPVRGPYTFKVYLTLLDAEGLAAGSHVIDIQPPGGRD